MNDKEEEEEEEKNAMEWFFVRLCAFIKLRVGVGS
jgi:hypothetical protein